MTPADDMASSEGDAHTDSGDSSSDCVSDSWSPERVSTLEEEEKDPGPRVTMETDSSSPSDKEYSASAQICARSKISQPFYVRICTELLNHVHKSIHSPNEVLFGQVHSHDQLIHISNAVSIALC
eukprot:208000_1